MNLFENNYPFKRKYVAVLCFLVIGVMIPKFSAEASVLDVSVQTKSQTELHLSWNGKKTTGYKVYRAIVKKNGKMGKYRLIATVSGSASAYKDAKLKKNREYHYMVNGYRNGKKVYSGTASGFTGVTCAFAENQNIDTAYSTKSITLYAVSEEGIRPAGYEIYRREKGANKFNRLARISKKSRSLKYVDKEVRAGACYEYKIRAFYKRGSKKYYSNFTDVRTMSAVRKVGKYDVNIIEDTRCAPNEMILQITAKTHNGTLQLGSFAEVTIEDKTGTEFFDTLQVIAYKKNEDDFVMYNKKDGELPLLNEGETMSIWVRLYESKNVPVIEAVRTFSVEMAGVKYNNLYSIFEGNLVTGSASAFVDKEYYH